MSQLSIQKIQERLLLMQDVEYRRFHLKLVPNLNIDTVIGVRTPELRAFARELVKNQEYIEFINTLPHKYYEEYNLHGFILEKIKDFNTVLTYIDSFLPYVDNWATCDLISPKVFKEHPAEILIKIKEWIVSDKVYVIRFGLEMLMSIFLDSNFTPEILSLAASVKSNEYYVKMMIAWFFATALAKQYEYTLPYIQNYQLDTWVHNKTIQKAVESYRISNEKKEYLKTFKLK